MLNTQYTYIFIEYDQIEIALKKHFCNLTQVLNLDLCDFYI
ncbi:hypothetical protein AQEC111735_03770 [Aquirufa ecclesiirivi]